MKTIYSIVIVILLNPLASLGQKEFVDSLINEYKNTSDLIKKTHLAIRISSNLVHVDDEKAVFFAHQAVSHANDQNDEILIAEANEAVASTYGANGNFLGAANVYMKSLLIYEAHNLHKKAAAVSNNIANAYLGIEDLEKAEEYYKRSYNGGLEAEDTNAIAVPLVGLSIIYEKKGEIEKALITTEEALPLFAGIKRMDALVVCYINAATYAYDIGQKEKAYNYTDKGKQINLSLNNKYYSGSISLIECGWYAEDGDFKNAIQSGEKGILDLSEVRAFHEIKNGYKQLSEVYEEAGETRNAHEYLKKYIHLRDSLEEVNRSEIMAEMDAKYNKVQDEKKIAELSHQSNLQHLQNEKNKTIMYLTVGAAIILMLFLGFAINANRQKNKINKTLQIQKSIIEEKNNEILDSIQYAKRIQNAIIPSDTMISRNLENSFVLYKPKDIVAGDFYWMEEIDDLILLAVADCTGHGVPGAMVSVVCNNALNRAVREFNLKEPAKILDKTREIVIETFAKSEENVKDGMDITLCAWNKKTNEIQYAGANNPLYILPNAQSEISVIPPDKQPIGLYAAAKKYTNHTIKLNKGDSIYLFSDGFVDQFGGNNGKKFKYSRFRDLIKSSQSESMKEQGRLIESEFNKWKGDLEQLDDVCVIGIRV